MAEPLAAPLLSPVAPLLSPLGMEAGASSYGSNGAFRRDDGNGLSSEGGLFHRDESGDGIGSLAHDHHDMNHSAALHLMRRNHNRAVSIGSEGSVNSVCSARQHSFDHTGLGRFSSVPSAISEGDHAQMPKQVTFVGLVFLIFYGVSGGPFGSEEAIQAAGPALTIAGFLLLPFVWSIPEAMVTAELSTAFPEASGFVAWVTEAYGPFWGFMEGYWSWLSGVADNSLYPVLFLDYLLELLSDDHPLGVPGPARAIFLLGVTCILSYISYRGLEVVGYTALAVCILSLSPFVVMSCWPSGYRHPGNWLDPPQGGWEAVDWSAFLNIMFWNLNYWDSAASFAGEVERPGHAFPRAMLTCVLLVILCNIGPVLAGTGHYKNPQYDEWEDGHFAQVARDLAGPWLGYWVIAAAAISNIGLFLAEMSSDSLQVMGMAERGMLPAAFAVRGKYGMPLLGTLASSCGVFFLGFLSFTAIVEILNFLYCWAQLLELSAFIQLRISSRHIHRPFEIPLGTVGVTLMLLPAFAFLIVLISLSSLLTWVICGSLMVSGVVMRYLLETAKRRQWCEFVDFGTGVGGNGGGSGSYTHLYPEGRSPRKSPKKSPLRR